VVLWEIEDGEHNWPRNMRFPAPDGTTRSTAEEILAFFAEHRRE
jgi:poly(3-hydroxybutyrate) depolymerase